MTTSCYSRLLSDGQTEYQSNGRMMIRDLFDLFHTQPEEAGLITHTATIVDAAFNAINQGKSLKISTSIVTRCLNICEP